MCYVQTVEEGEPGDELHYVAICFPRRLLACLMHDCSEVDVGYLDRAVWFEIDDIEDVDVQYGGEN